MNCRLRFAFLALAMCGALVADAVAGPISVGNLVVVRVGSGEASLSSSAQASFLEEFQTDGTAVQTIPLPTAVSGSHQPLTNNGTATSEGFLKQSGNGFYLTLAGYAATPGAANPANANASDVNRVVGRVEIATGDVDTTTALNDAYSGSNVRGAVSTNGNDIWLGGNAGSGLADTSGVQYATLGNASSVRVNDGGGNRRVVGIFDGRLYVSAASGSFQSLSTMDDPLPKGPGQDPEAVLPGMPTASGSSIYDFWFRDSSTVYLASESNAANNGGIQKWTFDGADWSLAYVLLNTGAATTAVRGLTGMIDSNGDTILYATTTQTSNNNLISIVDGGAGGGTPTILASAGQNRVFRGVEYIEVPIPEPASMALFGLATLVVAAWKRRR